MLIWCLPYLEHFYLTHAKRDVLCAGCFLSTWHKLVIWEGDTQLKKTASNRFPVGILYEAFSWLILLLWENPDHCEHANPCQVVLDCMTEQTQQAMRSKPIIILLLCLLLSPCLQVLLASSSCSDFLQCWNVIQEPWAEIKPFFPKLILVTVFYNRNPN